MKIFNNTLIHNIPDNKNSNAIKSFAKNNVVENLIRNSESRSSKINIRPLITRMEIAQLAKPMNLLGEGNAHRVYLLENYPNLVLRVPKNFDLEENSLLFYKPIYPKLSKYNFGNTICDFGQGVQVLNKVEGEPNSFPSWINYMKNTIFHSKLIAKHDAEKVLMKFTKIADFPESSYVDLAEKLNFLNKTQYTLDFLNPNNILVDEKYKKFNIIDLWENGKYGVDGISGYEHMTLMLCDGILHNDIIKALSPDQRNYLDDIVIKIIEKCKSASKKVQLPSAEYEILNVFSQVDKLKKNNDGVDLNYVKRYKDFKTKYDL